MIRSLQIEVLEELIEGQELFIDNLISLSKSDFIDQQEIDLAELKLIHLKEDLEKLLA